MRRSAWDDLREDARTFSRQNPQTGHTLVCVPDRSTEGVAAIDVDADGSGDFAAMLAGAFNTDGPLRALQVGGIESRIRHRTQRTLGDDDGFVAEWLWSDPVGGTIHPNEEVGQAWPRLCDALWQLVVDRVDSILPVALAAGDVDAPAIGKEPNTSDAAQLLHWLAWSGQVEGLRANVGWRLLFRPTDDSQLAEFATFPKTLTQSSPFDAGRPEHPAAIPNKPWLHVAGWWWSTIEPAGAALISAVDWLRTAVVADRVQAGAAAVGALAGGVIPDASGLPVDPNADATPRRPVAKLEGWTKSELVAKASISDSTFDRIREAAGVKASESGGRGQQRRFSPAELAKLIEATEAGTFRSKTATANSWRELLPE
ncbi:MAG: hypothetical protein GY715_06545 [Planctomycetes bacterium]|nr:hypothetical protein [Planctomycetota bacterium]